MKVTRQVDQNFDKDMVSYDFSERIAKNVGKVLFPDFSKQKEVDKTKNISISNSLYYNVVKMEKERGNGNVVEVKKEQEKTLAKSLEFHCKEIQSILEANPEVELPDDFTKFIANQVKGVLNTLESNSEVRLNELGLPMQPLEIEVADMIEQAKQGKRVFPKYDRKVDETPLKYLEKYFGKYLKAFGAEEDYIYQHQLQAIDAKFRNNLRMYLNYHDMDIASFISTKSKLIDKEVELLGIANIGSRKIFNLAQAR